MKSEKLGYNELFKLYESIFEAVNDSKSSEDTINQIKEMLVNPSKFTKPRKQSSLDNMQGKKISKGSKKAKSKSNLVIEGLSDGIGSLKTFNDVNELYINELAKFYNNEDSKKDILKKYTANDLRYLYSIISGSELSQKTRKEELINMIKKIIISNDRTRALKL